MKGLRAKRISGVLFQHRFFCLWSTVFSVWLGNETTFDVMVRSQEIPRIARYLGQKDLEYNVVIEDLQKQIDEENPVPSEEEMQEMEGRFGS